MKLTLCQIDAFTDKVFGGNPAAVCPLDNWLDDDILQKIAAENNLSETAFFVKNNEAYELRWFTPKVEVDLCGHATLATAYLLFNYMKVEADEIKFITQSGIVTAKKEGEYIALDFPAWLPEEIETPDELVKGLKIVPDHSLVTRDIIAVYQNEQQIIDLNPDHDHLMKLDQMCVIATAPGENFDFVSRVFVPKVGIDEDPVTGSAHSSLIPYWAEALNKLKLSAAQLSTRKGYLECELMGDRVKISGKCITYLEGYIHI